MASGNNYTLSASPYGVGNVLGTLYNTAAPFVKSYLENRHKHPNKNMTHTAMLAETPMTSPPVSIKRKRVSGVMKKKKDTKKSPPKKRKKKTQKEVKQTENLPDIF
jgi:hypothetical protein